MYVPVNSRKASAVSSVAAGWPGQNNTSTPMACCRPCSGTDNNTPSGAVAPAAPGSTVWRAVAALCASSPAASSRPTWTICCWYMPQLYPCGRLVASPANTTAPAIAPKASPSSCKTRSTISAELRVLRTRCAICSSHCIGLPVTPETACLRILIPSQRVFCVWTCRLCKNGRRSRTTNSICFLGICNI